MMVHGAPSVEESQETGANVGDARLSTTQQAEKARCSSVGDPRRNLMSHLSQELAHKRETSVITKLG